MRKIILSTLLILMSAWVYGGGYRVTLQGQKALAMGHTGVAIVQSSESVFFNPAGLVYLEDTLNVTAGISGVFMNIAYQNTVTGVSERSESPMGMPFYVYASYKANDWMAFGLGVYVPYGSEVRYPEGWAGSHLVNSIALQAIYIQPTVSFKLNDIISFGGGPIFAIGSVDFDRSVNRTLTDLEGNRSTVNVEASNVTSWGWVASTMIHFTENLHFGATYRSKIDLNADDGQATFQNIPNSPLTPFEDSKIAAGLPMPAEMTVGISYDYKDWIFAFDYNRTFWNAYHSLDIEFQNPNIPDSKNPRNYKNSSIYRFGLQYDVNQTFALRGGYYYDKSPVRVGYFAPETPRNDSSNFTAGMTVNIGSNFQIDAAFLYSYYKEINASYDYYYEDGVAVPFGGTYKSNAFAPSIGITYKM